MTADEQKRRLALLYRHAETAEQEKGVNILYLAVGFLTWFESENSQIEFESPLILLPVDLKRSKGGFTLRSRGDDIVTNLPLQKRLNDDFGIQLPKIDDSDEWVPSNYFALVKDAIAERPQWQIDRDSIRLGFFSFAKFLMYRDLDPDKWHDKSITKHKPIQELLIDGFSPNPLWFGDDESLDEKLDPQNVFHVTDADASQTIVIEEVRKGNSLVVQGPPGTGKSQTITNILAAAVFDGKKTLFIAEKLAALEVVHKRMVGAGLNDICLALHTKVTKKSMLEELKRTLKQPSPKPDDCASELRDVRDQLTVAADLLHRNLPERDYNPFQAMTTLALLNNFYPLEIADGLEKLTQQKCDDIREDICNYVTALKKVGLQSEHPFTGVKQRDLLPPDLKRLENKIDKAIKSIDRLNEILGKISEQTEMQFVNSIETARQLDKWIRWVRRLRFMPIALVGFTIEIFGRVDALKTDLLMVDTATTRRTVDAIRDGFKGVSQLTKALTTTDGDIKYVFDLLKLKLPKRLPYSQAALDNIKNRLVGMRENIDRYNEWGVLQSCTVKLKNHKLASLIKLVERKKITPDDAENQFRYEVSEARWRHACEQLPALHELVNTDRHELAKDFQTYDKQHIQNARKQIRAQHHSNLSLTGNANEMNFLNGEMARLRNIAPIRRIMERAGAAVSQIKPVFLMTPMSVAQFLPPGKIEFDLLVIDEASQVPPVDALGAVARCKQIVVVGDQKQLPPTSFFDKITRDDEDEENEYDDVASAGEMESILTLCEARGLNSRMLKWHYRSRDPSLITVSNAEFYGNRLLFPPSPLRTGDIGLKFKKVDGVYAGGTNQIEANEIVVALAEHAKNNPKQSIGIVAFSQKQSNLIHTVLEDARQSDSVLDKFLLKDDESERYFVKNIENVQGDERDVIFISVGYGPEEPGGRLRMNFGPVNNEGGERRLNVLFTRARISCCIFASFTSGSMDVSNTINAGPRVLKRFLEYAQTGKLEHLEPSGKLADSPLEEDVAQEIIALGYLADPQVSSAGFKIDIGVRTSDMPGRYILAVECDGASYHSSRYARDRDRLRQELLESKEWRFHRIWSTDWFHRRADEIQRLKEALETARHESDGEPKFSGANHQRLPVNNHPTEDDLPDEAPPK